MGGGGGGVFYTELSARSDEQSARGWVSQRTVLPSLVSEEADKPPPDDCALVAIPVAPPPPPPQEHESNPYRQRPEVSAVADNALAAAVNTILRLKAANEPGGVLAKYASTHTGSPPLPPFRLGFGLHLGWAVEGAIGSQRKMDASYLSPNVNVTARLEAATRVYGVDLLLSQAFAECLSEGAQNLLRTVDRVRLNGAGAPFYVYTLDCCGGGRVRYGGATPGDLAAMQPGGEFPPSFFAHADAAVSAFLGDLAELDWVEARHHAVAALAERPGDGPLTWLVGRVDAAGGAPPTGWEGCSMLK